MNSGVGRGAEILRLNGKRGASQGQQVVLVVRVLLKIRMVSFGGE